MEAQINTNKANLSNKVLLYFCHPLKHTSYNLWGECLDLWSESFKSSAPLSSLFAVLRNSLILPHQWCSTEKSRPLHCQSLRVPVLFDNVFCGSLDSPPFLLFFPPLHALSLFASSIILLTRFRVFLRCLAGDGGGYWEVGWREDREVCHWFEKEKGLSLLAASQGEPKRHRTIWSLPTIKLLFSHLFFSHTLSFFLFIFLKKLVQSSAFFTPRQGAQVKDVTKFHQMRSPLVHQTLMNPRGAIMLALKVKAQS